jgi:hypothetical protein
MSSEVMTQKNNSNVLLRLWRGDIALWKTYWLYGGLGGIIISVLAPLLTYILASNASLMSRFDLLVIYFLFFALVLIYTLIVSVGSWRSSSKYAILYPKRRGYAIFAKIAVVFGILSTAGELAEIALDKSDPITSLSTATSTDEKMQYQAVASGLNADLSKMLDAETRLNKIDLDSAGYIYHLTITKESDSRDKEQLLNSIKPQVVSHLCKNSDTSEMLNSGVSFTYIYSDAGAQPIGKITVTKPDCDPQ